MKIVVAGKAIAATTHGGARNLRPADRPRDPGNEEQGSGEQRRRPDEHGNERGLLRAEQWREQRDDRGRSDIGQARPVHRQAGRLTQAGVATDR